ncbi:hypothetical protein RHS01_08250 [Rhizoctonia solani]|uniref:Uncharacterized protein n=1 Tax=Rhizoctonia solani TaxID=456999 RepID=A0A8H7I6I6_9AGAM|nr:hypothetical protein RHS01_08250 [Rhizoctonia solani]
MPSRECAFLVQFITQTRTQGGTPGLHPEHKYIHKETRRVKHERGAHRVEEATQQEEGPRNDVSTAGKSPSVVSLGEADNLGIPEAGSLRSVNRRLAPAFPPRFKGHTKRVRRRRRVGSEDSETPWSCTLRVLPLDPGSSIPSPISPSSEPLKLRLAHLVPAPHHPKVIGQFKMPFPLPDVHVQNLELVPRSMNDPFGMGEGKGDGSG